MSCNGEPLALDNALESLATDPEFRNWFLEDLRSSPFSSFFWETPAVTLPAAQATFEYVLVDAPSLASQRPDTWSFREYFEGNRRSAGVAIMENLGRDAVLVVPEILDAPEIYTDLATFLRRGPESQQHDLLIALVKAVRAWKRDRPLWVSTSGLGVAWLHIRLDSRPKYYQYTPYRAPPGTSTTGA